MILSHSIKWNNRLQAVQLQENNPQCDEVQIFEDVIFIYIILFLFISDYSSYKQSGSCELCVCSQCNNQFIRGKHTPSGTLNWIRCLIIPMMILLTNQSTSESTQSSGAVLHVNDVYSDPKLRVTLLFYSEFEALSFKLHICN